MRARLRRTTALILLILLLLPSWAMGSGDFTPQPTTPYASQFIADCEGQQWFINELERLLNLEQKTLNSITGSADFANIKSLGLADAKISGKLPKAIGHLTELQYLFLGGNTLSAGGGIPAELYTLSKLQNLDLSGNGYGGAIPAQLGGMPSLRILNLKDNAFTGTIPAELLSNTTIEVLNLLSNALTGGIPADIKDMTGLIYLNLSDNDLRGSIPDLTGLTALETLSLWNCALTGELHSSVYQLTELQVLDLAQNLLTGEISASIGNLTKAEYITLAQNELTGNIPTQIENLTVLERLNLSDNKLRGTIPDVFTAPTLTEIDLRNNYLRGTVPASLKARYTGGATVYLQNNYLTGSDLRDMPNNEKNFADGASSQQYQLTASAKVQISTSTAKNIYTLLQNKSLTTGNTTQKIRLNPDEYHLVYDAAKLTVTVDATGIHVTAADEIPLGDNETIEIWILANDGSNYSKVTIVVTTDTVGGGGGGVTPGVPAPEGETETHKPYVTGYVDGTFGPERNIAREEVVAMLIRALDLDEDLSAKRSSFHDVDLGRWSVSYIEEARRQGYITGYPNGDFGPSDPMTRAELAACLVRIAGQQGKETGESGLVFGDVAQGLWYTEYVYQAAQYGLVTGYTDGTFRPTAMVTRSEAVTMINRMLGRNPETAPALETAENPFSDVSERHWAYLQILEAGLLHEHEVTK